MSPTEQSIMRILRKHMPDILASSVRRRALSAIGVSEGQLAASDLRRFIAERRTGLRLFADPAVHAQVLDEMGALIRTEIDPTGEVLIVRSEQDVSRVRMRARELAVALGGGSFVIQRAVT